MTDEIIATVMLASKPSPPLPTPEASPSPLVADSPSQSLLGVPIKGKHHSYHLTIIPAIGISITVLAAIMLLVLVVLIRRKKRELEGPDNYSKTTSKATPSCSMWKFQEGMALDSSSYFIFFLSRNMQKTAVSFFFYSFFLLQGLHVCLKSSTTGR